MPDAVVMLKIRCACGRWLWYWSGQAPPPCPNAHNDNTCVCGHRRRDHRIEGPPGRALSEIRWFECEVCTCTQFDGGGAGGTMEP